MLDQVLLARAFGQDRGHQLPGGVELVIAREDNGRHLLFAVTLGDQVAPEDLQPAVPGPDLLPQVGGAVPLGINRVAGAAVVAQVEGQEGRGRALQPGGHHHFAVADGEVDESAAGEVQQGLGMALTLGLGLTVEAVLVDGVLHPLGEVALELDRGDRKAVQEEHQVNGVLIGGGVADLADDAEAVGGVAGLQLWVHAKGRLELSHLQGLLQAQELEAMADDIQGAALIQALAQAIQQGDLGQGSMVPAQSLPRLRCHCLHPGHDIDGIERQESVIPSRIAFGIEPAISSEARADVVLELDFLVQAHAALKQLREFKKK